MKNQTGFGLIGVLLIIGTLLLTAGGVVVWKKKISPGPIEPLIQIPTLTPSPKPESTFPTEYSCNDDNDCVVKKRPFCCGESLQYYNWCYHKDTEPEIISCKGVGSCPGVMPITSCVCQDGRCTGTTTLEQSPPIEAEGNPYTWTVEKVCIPSYVIGKSYPVIIKDLGDETYIYRRPDESLFRGTQNQCRCLASTTKISTPEGEKLVKDLKPGTLVWTLNDGGRKIAAPIIKTSTIPVPQTHQVSHLILADRRELFASPQHPTADGGTLGRLSPGDILDGSRVISVKLILYQEDYTYDILPEGGTSLYWANGVLLKSTLSE